MPTGSGAYHGITRGFAGRRRGVSAILVVVVLVVLIFFVAIAVDMGRVYLARAEMQTVADAAARSGALSLPVSNQQVFDDASDAAMANPVIDTEKDDADHMGMRTNPGVELDTDDDIVFGIWRDNPPAGEDNFKELTDLGSTKRDERRAANAVMAWGRRIEDRDNPLPLIFGPALGRFHTDIESRAIAMVYGGNGSFSFIGIDRVRAVGNKANINPGSVGSDGDISLGNSDIYGDARAGIGKSLMMGPNSIVTGWTANLDFKLKPLYPPVPATEYAAATPVTGYKKNKPLTLVGGATKATAKKFIFTGSFDHPDPLTITGYVILYVLGDVNIQGNQLINTTPPPSADKLQLRVVGAHSVDLGGTSLHYAHVYAPESDVTVHGGPGFYGSIVGKTLEFKGNPDLHGTIDPDANKDIKVRLVK